MRDGSQPEAQAVSPPDRQAHRAKRRGLAPAVEAGLDNCPDVTSPSFPGRHGHGSRRRRPSELPRLQHRTSRTAARLELGGHHSPLQRSRGTARAAAEVVGMSSRYYARGRFAGFSARCFASPRSSGCRDRVRSEFTTQSSDDRRANRIRMRTSRSSDSGATNRVRNMAASPCGSSALLCGQRQPPSCSTEPESSVVTAAPTAPGSTPGMRRMTASWTNGLVLTDSARIRWPNALRRVRSRVRGRRAS